MSNEPEPIDCEAIYDEQIAPLIDQITAICQEHRIPMVASFCYRYTDANDASYCTTHLYPGVVTRFDHARLIITARTTKEQPK